MTATELETAAADVVEHFDVLIVGAGISGVGAAYHMLDQCPGKSFVVLENQAGFGGTWRTHKYPGIRSDSDLYTFGYRFKPWVGAPIASAAEILKYMGEVIADNNLDQHIRYQHKITDASWSSDDAKWTLYVERLDTGERLTFTCGFLWMCQGYYRHEHGYTPQWEGMGDFEGQIVHPQEWPDDLDYAGKSVVVIGSGATAATLIPALADEVGHVTMLQRSPTYFRAARNVNDLADQLRELDVPDEWTHEIVRRRAVKDGAFFAQMAVEYPDLVKEELFKGITEIMGDDYDLAPHFTPNYRPWQQRVAFVPDGDLFHAIKSGKASVATDRITRFTKTGIELESGDHLDADIIITATGFDLNVLGDVEFTIANEPLHFYDTVTYRGSMFTGIPNMVWVFGYFRASWTLKVDLLADFVCRLLTHMDELGASTVVPQLRDHELDMELGPWVDEDNFNPGYMQRNMHLMPHQGQHEPWVHSQDYVGDREAFPKIDLDDGALRFS